MKYNFDQIIDRSGTFSLKWDKYKGTDIIPMWVADMDFKAPQPVLDALRQCTDHGIFGYTVIPDALNAVIVERMKRLYNWEIEKEWIIWIPGVVTGLNVACRAFGKPDGKIVTTTPIYPPFLSAHKNAGRELITVPMKHENQRACLDFNGLENAFKQGAGVFAFCSPYNPCGTVFRKTEIKRLVELCLHYDVIICSDEIHSDLVLDENRVHIPTPSISETASQQSFSLMAPSKTYNIPGMGCSFAIMPNAELRKSFHSSSQGVVPDLNIMGIAAARAAYEKCDDWLEALIVYLRKNRDMVLEQVSRMQGCRANPIESTYLAWIDVRDLNLDDPAAFFEQAGVGLSDGGYFGQKGFVRLNFGCPASILEKGLARMARHIG